MSERKPFNPQVKAEKQRLRRILEDARRYGKIEWIAGKDHHDNPR